MDVLEVEKALEKWTFDKLCFYSAPLKANEWQ